MADGFPKHYGKVVGVEVGFPHPPPPPPQRASQVGVQGKLLPVVRDVAPAKPRRKDWSTGCLQLLFKSPPPLPWRVWLSWLEHHPVAKGLRVLFPVRAQAWAMGSIPSQGVYGRQPIDASLTSMLSVSPLLSL